MADPQPPPAQGGRTVWRLTRPAHAPGLDGEGARLHGGRWNSPGRPAVYCASSLALAVLESFVHLPPALRRVDTLPPMVAVGLVLPDGLRAERVAAIPADADAAWFRAVGDDWLARAASVAFDVPSLVVPPERNLLLNPRHSDMAAISVALRQEFRYDPRLVV